MAYILLLLMLSQRVCLVIGAEYSGSIPLDGYGYPLEHVDVDTGLSSCYKAADRGPGRRN